GPVDLDHLDALAAQETDEAGAVGAAAFNSGSVEPAELASPHHELAVAPRGRRDMELTEASTDVVDHHRHVRVGVRVDTDDHLAGPILVCCHGTCAPWLAGREHRRPGRRTGHLGCRPTLLSGHVRPTGRCASNRRWPTDRS